ncbi:MAG: hypothetical protein NVSMB23_17180 [Myxococcales bacterium]
MTAGCTGEVRGGILTLTLDTVGSSVNVFTPAIALELEAALARGLAAGARAVVLRSAKPGSFVNGVGLLLAASSHSQEAAMERARTLQRCYESLAAAPVPTIAAIEGNCYGCGLELALTCDYRIARGTYDAHFYMSELRDYAFIPLFGGTQRLPRLLGLAAGMRLLLGERVPAREALRIGLIDALAPAAGVDRTLRSLLADLRARGFPKRPDRGPVRRGSPAAAAAAVARVPCPARALARECLRLARLPFRRGYRLEDGLREELASFWRSIRTPHAERAMSFFFVRQGAKAHAIGSASYERPRRLSVGVDARTPALRTLLRSLRARPLAGVAVTAGRARGGSDDRARLAFAPEKVDGLFTCALGPGATDADCRAFLPFPGMPIPPIELVPARHHRCKPRLLEELEERGPLPPGSVVERGDELDRRDRHPGKGEEGAAIGVGGAGPQRAGEEAVHLLRGKRQPGPIVGAAPRSTTLPGGRGPRSSSSSSRRGLHRW